MSKLKPSEIARTQEVRRIGSDMGIQAARALSKAFQKDPFLSWLCSKPSPQNAQDIWWEWILKHPQAFSEVHAIGDLSGVAMWSPSPDLAKQMQDQSEFHPPDFGGEFVDFMKQLCGKAADARLEVLGQMMGSHPQGEWWYLSAIGVVPKHCGKGRGTLLIQTMLSRLDQEGWGSYLEATTLESKALYHRLGYKELETLQLGDAPALYPMWRDPA